MFGIKDIFTTINLLGGIVGICLCIEGEPYYAGVSVMLGYLFGDTLDGYVARKLNSANQFGAEYDTIADHLSHVVAPAAIVYTVYKDTHLLPHPWDKVLAGFLAACILIAVSIRHARNIVESISYKGVWTGLPRTVVGFLAIGYCNSQFPSHVTGGWWAGVVIIPIVSIATLSYWPYPNHHFKRAVGGHWWYVNALVWAFLLITLATIVFARAWTFDVVTIFMVGYTVGAWYSLTPEERVKHRAIVAEARAAAAAAA